MPDFLKQKQESSPEVPMANPEAPRAAEIQEALEIQPAVEKPAETKAEAPSRAPAAVQSHVIPASERVEHPQTKSEELQVIEKVMASGLEEIYINLDPKTKQIVKTEGEITANKIEALLQSGKEVAKKVLQLIRAWLHKIPGVNSFFLEQESKIKTDKILAMKRRE
ncbi:MAG: hypothetical protein AAB880_00215 [Patescibacteria group bacterium]